MKELTLYRDVGESSGNVNSVIKSLGVKVSYDYMEEFILGWLGGDW